MAMRHYDPRTHHEAIFSCAPFGKEAPAKTLLLDVRPDRFDPRILWCRSWGLGLVRFDMRDGSFTPLVDRMPLTDLSNIVYAAAQLDRDHWMLNLDNELVEWTNGRMVHTGINAGHGGLWRSPTGELFIGSFGGVHVLREAPNGMHALEGALAMSNTHAVATEGNDGFWVTRFYSDREVLRCDRDGAVLARYPFPDEGRPFEAFDIMLSRRGASAGTLWVASTHGLWCVRRGATALERVPLRVSGSDDRPDITAIAEGDDGSIWLCVGNAGVLRYDAATGITRSVVSADRTNDRFVAMTRFDDAHLLATSRSGTPLLFSNDGGTIVPIRTSDDARIFTKLEGALPTTRGRILLYTAGLGLLRLAPGPDSSWHVERRWYLPDRPVFDDVATDTCGRVWLTSDRGAYLLDPATDELHALDALHGCLHVFSGSASAATNGEVLLSGDGMALFDPGFGPPRDTVVLALRHFVVNGHERTAEALASSVPVRLMREENDISIAFGTIALFAGDAFTFSYRLVHDGESADEIPLGAQRTLNLVGLAPGRYDVELKASGVSTRPVSTSIRFIIDPAWWQTWWARTASALAGVALVVLGTRAVLTARYRRKLRELEREREVEQVRMRIARDIHDGIGSGLTKITMMTRKLKGDGEEAQRIARASTELVNELGEIVWTVDPRNDSYGSFIAFVRNSLGRQFEDLGVTLRTELTCAKEDLDRSIGPELKRNVMLVMREAVNNALKHSGATRIDVALDLRRDNVKLSVKDDGRGFDPSNTREGANGLVNFRKRAEAAGGTVDVLTGPEGTSVILDVPVPSTNM
jgi:signal transduction histidine kinase/streptogramin lyase